MCFFFLHAHAPKGEVSRRVFEILPQSLARVLSKAAISLSRDIAREKKVKGARAACEKERLLSHLNGPSMSCAERRERERGFIGSQSRG